MEPSSSANANVGGSVSTDVSTGVRARLIAGEGSVTGLDVRLRAAADMTTVMCIGRSCDTNGNVEGIGIVAICMGANTDVSAGAGVVVDLDASSRAAGNTCTATTIGTSSDENQYTRESLSVDVSVNKSDSVRASVSECE